MDNDRWTSPPLDQTSTDNRPNTWVRTAVLMWTIFAAVLGVKTIVEPRGHSTYPCFEFGARRWWKSTDLYQPAIREHDFRYAPAFAAAFVPLALLPTELGGLIWALLSLAVFFWTVRTLIGRLLPRNWPREGEGLLLLLILLGSIRSAWSLQTNLLIFTLIGQGCLAILDGRWWRAALLLAIPVPIKVWPLAAAALMVMCWPRRLAWRFPICLAVTALPLLTKPFSWVWRQHVDWYHVLLHAAEDRHEYRDVWTIWENFGKPDLRIYIALQLTMAAAVAVLCLWQVWKGRSTQRLLTFILVTWTCWQMVLGPATERNTFALVAPLTAWGLVTALKEPWGRWVMIAAYVLTVGATSGVLERHLAETFPLIEVAHPVGVILFAAWFLVWNARTPEAPASISA